MPQRCGGLSKPITPKGNAWLPAEVPALVANHWPYPAIG
jgi:hypothetical protein